MLKYGRSTSSGREMAVGGQRRRILRRLDCLKAVGDEVKSSDVVLDDVVEVGDTVLGEGPCDVVEILGEGGGWSSS